MNAGESNLEDYKHGIDELEAASLSFIIDAFCKLGFSFEKGKIFSRDDLQNTLKIAGKHFRLFGRLLEILEQNDIIKIKEGNFEVLLDINSHSIESGLTNIVMRIKTNSSAKAECNLLLTCGPKLSDVLTGDQDPLQLLFPNGDFSAATMLYQNSPGFVVMNEFVKMAVEGFTKNIPENRIIKVLEIGAGTGGTTSYILPVLAKVKSEYTFTDISAAFFKNAREKFKDYLLINYKVLNIERDVSKQGFAEINYDLIIASNVIHATKDLQVTIKNILDLLSPGGALILNEVTEKQGWIDLTFGLTDGWWRFEDSKLRASYPLLSNDEWKEFLTSNGFSKIEISSPKLKNKSLTGQSTITGIAHSHYAHSDTSDTKEEKALRESC